MSKQHEIAAKVVQRLSEALGPLKPHHYAVLHAIHRDREKHMRDWEGKPRSDAKEAWGIHHHAHDPRVVRHLAAHGHLELKNPMDKRGRPDPNSKTGHMVHRITAKGYKHIADHPEKAA